jgi:hypothetical protein
MALAVNIGRFGDKKTWQRLMSDAQKSGGKPKRPDPVRLNTLFSQFGKK